MCLLRHRTADTWESFATADDGDLDDSRPVPTRDEETHVREIRRLSSGANCGNVDGSLTIRISFEVRTSHWSACRIMFGMTEDSVLSAWRRLPRRMYLDTSVLQTVYDFGAVLFDGGPLDVSDHAARVAGIQLEVDALQAIFEVNTRAGFEFVVTEAALLEVLDRGKPGYSQWVLDMMDVWATQSTGDLFTPSVTRLDHPSFGMISMKDRALLQDALDRQCDAFMTMERRLPTAAAFIEQRTGLRILRPSAYWRLLHRWAALYR